MLLMVLGGLRAAEVRSLRLADVDQGRRRVRIVGKGGRERIVPALRAYLSVGEQLTRDVAEADPVTPARPRPAPVAPALHSSGLDVEQERSAQQRWVRLRKRDKAAPEGLCRPCPQT